MNTCNPSGKLSSAATRVSTASLGQENFSKMYEHCKLSQNEASKLYDKFRPIFRIKRNSERGSEINQFNYSSYFAIPPQLITLLKRGYAEWSKIQLSKTKLADSIENFIKISIQDSGDCTKDSLRNKFPTLSEDLLAWLIWSHTKYNYTPLVSQTFLVYNPLLSDLDVAICCRCRVEDVRQQRDINAIKVLGVGPLSREEDLLILNSHNSPIQTFILARLLNRKPAEVFERQKMLYERSAQGAIKHRPAPPPGSATTLQISLAHNYFAYLQYYRKYCSEFDIAPDSAISLLLSDSCIEASIRATAMNKSDFHNCMRFHDWYFPFSPIEISKIR